MVILELDQVNIEVDGRPILHDITLRIESGETHVLFGPNGSGKTSLLMAIMGLPRYRVISGVIQFQGQDISSLSIDARARLGIGLVYQRPPTLRGLRLDELAGICAGTNQMAATAELAEKLHMSNLLQRNVNDGFSGGELKKSELLQLLLRRPVLSLIDEPDAGVDLDSIVMVGETIKQVLEQPSTGNVPPAGLIITHTGHILRYLQPTRSHVLYGGTLVAHAEGAKLLAEIQTYGYGK
ncbi:MAG: ABC transporter ATP-binding protein, partial [Nitrospiria bacterium]